MRKHILTAIIVAAAIGVAAYVSSGPREGTVEWHKREYVSAAKRVAHGTWCPRLKRIYYGLIRTKPPPDLENRDEDWERLLASQTELVRLGYLVRSRFTVTNRSAGDVIEYFIAEFIRDKPFNFLDVNQTEEMATNEIIVTAPSTFMPTAEAWIRKTDVVETK